MGILGLVWAAVKFMAPIAERAFATQLATLAATRVANVLLPEASAAGVPPEIIERATSRSIQPADEQVLQPVFVNTLKSQPALAASIAADLKDNVPDVARLATRADHLFSVASQLGDEFATGMRSLSSFDETFAATLHFTDEQTIYWVDHRCPKGGEPAIVVTYLDGLGRQTAMSPGPEYLMDDQGRTVRNVVRARCQEGHQWPVFT